VDPSVPGDGPAHPPPQGGSPNSSIPSLKILQLNVAGLRSGEVELLKFLQDEKIDVACIQDTNLSAGARPRLTGWQLVGHKSRTISRAGDPTRSHHGGAAFLIREGLQYEDKPEVAAAALAPGDDTTECTAVKIHDPRARRPIIVVNVYVPPVRASDGRSQGFNPDFLPAQPDTFILGDFNAHWATWDSSGCEDNEGERLDDWALLSGFIALNDGSLTRVSPRGITTAPDVSFVPASCEQHLSWRIGNHVGSDHLPIVIEIVGGKPAKSPRRKATYKKADWDLFHQSLDEALQDWDISPPTTGTGANAFLSAAILEAAKKAIPKGSRKTQCAWWSPEVEDAVIFRRQAQEALKVDPDDDMKATAYQEAAAAAQTTINDAKTKLWREFISDSHGDLTPAEVWAVIRTIDGRSPASAP